MKTLLVLFIAICAQVLGDINLTKGMKTVGEVNTLDPLKLFQLGVQVFTNPYVWLGIVLLSGFYLLYLVALSWADLSFVLPVTAFGYLLNALLSWLILQEPVSPARWLGTFIICVGVAVVSSTAQKTTEQKGAGTA
jgi:drug/metabolite transporter (DMT)-like permease